MSLSIVTRGFIGNSGGATITTNKRNITWLFDNKNNSTLLCKCKQDYVSHIGRLKPTTVYLHKIVTEDIVNHLIKKENDITNIKSNVILER